VNERGLGNFTGTGWVWENFMGMACGCGPIFILLFYGDVERWIRHWKSASILKYRHCTTRAFAAYIVHKSQSVSNEYQCKRTKSALTKYPRVTAHNNVHTMSQTAMLSLAQDNAYSYTGLL